jgi:hypothetical protein
MCNYCIQVKGLICDCKCSILKPIHEDNEKIQCYCELCNHVIIAAKFLVFNTKETDY